MQTSMFFKIPLIMKLSQMSRNTGKANAKRLLTVEQSKDRVQNSFLWLYILLLS